MSLTSGYGGSVYLVCALCLTSYLSASGGTRSSSEPNDAPRPIVTIPQGRLEGINMLTSQMGRIYGFRGVPYAQPPVGDLRFKAPVASTAWNGTYDASIETECLQISPLGGTSGNEDCLYLNLYTPNLPSGRKLKLLPVMFFIVGGAFQSTDPSRDRYNPDFLLNHQDVILIVPSYRLGPLGFLSTGDEVAPGNFGLKDVVHALQWTQDNVKYFGGDPKRVTLFGGSSGAVSVSWLALSDATKGLFHQIITQSGSALIPDLQEPNESYVSRAIQLGEHFGCPSNSSTLLVDCLRCINGTHLVDTVSIFWEWREYPIHVWLPTIEPDIDGALITKTPARLMAEGKSRDVPLISTNVRDEGLLHAIQFSQIPSLLDAVISNFDVAMPMLAGYGRSSSNSTAYTEALKSYYLNDLTADRSVLITNVSQLLGDIINMYPSYSELQQRLSFATEPSYYMSFEHRGVFSYSYYYSGGETTYTGVAHGEEIIYLFKINNNLFGPPSCQYSKDDLTLVEKMVSMWTSFATCGEPTPADADGRILWEPYTSKKNYLQVGNGSEIGMHVKYGLLRQRMEFLDDLAAAIPWK